MRGGGGIVGCAAGHGEHAYPTYSSLKGIKGYSREGKELTKKLALVRETPWGQAVKKATVHSRKLRAARCKDPASRKRSRGSTENKKGKKEKPVQKLRTKNDSPKGSASIARQTAPAETAELWWTP